MKNITLKFLAARDGTVAVIFVIGFSAMAGIWALSIDLGRAWNLETQLQNAADASALACASQLDQEPGALARARLAAMGGLVQNQQSLAQDGAGANVTITAADIVFYSNIAAKTVTAADADANYCEVTASPRSVNTIFAGLINSVATISPRARAVAELATAHCRIPPILICNPTPGAFQPELLKGQGITLKDQGGGGLAPGNFSLLALPSEEKAILSTNDIRDAWARVRPLNQCFGDTVTTKPGQSTAIRQGLNMRFDIFFQGTHQVPSGEPPVKSNPNYTPAVNNVKGLKPGSQCSYQHPQGWKKTNPHKYNKTSEAALPTVGVDAMGFPRDECAYGGACDVNIGGDHLGDGFWAYETYMEINHPGVDLDTVSIPNLNGFTRPHGIPSRHEVYAWEIDPLNLSIAPQEYADVMCHTATQEPPDILDRRVISAAVVDCSKLAGTTEIKPDAWVDLFLTEPMGVYDGANDLYAEIMGPSDQGISTVVWYLLRLVE